MKVKIKKIYEEGQTLRVVCEHPYGIDNLGIALEKKDSFDFRTGEPKWINEVKRLLEKKYKNAKAPNTTTKYEGQEIDINTE